MKPWTALVLVLVAGCGTAPRAQVQSAAEPSGEALFEQVCAACHRDEGAQAPQMREIARSYLAAAGDSAAAVGRVARWIESPSLAETALGGHTLDDWGLMPMPQLKARERLAVARYVITLAR